MDVKIFIGNDTEKLEAEISAWLRNHQTTKIKFITQSQERGTTEELGFVVVCIWYAL